MLTFAQIFYWWGHASATVAGVCVGAATTASIALSTGYEQVVLDRWFQIRA